MKHVATALAFVLSVAPAYAQLGGILDKANRMKDTADKLTSIVISDKDERAIGEAVSDRLRTEFGVMQDEDVTRYVTLAGMLMAQASSRPGLKWEFIVLDTDGVNAFAAPGGLVHITRGALGLIEDEAELAGVLAHEIAHVTKKHTVNAIQKSKTIKLTTDIAPGTAAYYGLIADVVYDNIVEKGFNREDEEDADQEGLRMANKAGYSPNGLAVFLGKLAERNKTEPQRNALFASHPETRGRIDKINRQVKSEKLGSTATVLERYAATIDWVVLPLEEIQVATGVAGSMGAAAGSAPAKTEEEKKKEEPPKKSGGFTLRNPLKISSGAQQESTQASASAGGRAVGKDRAAKGGDNPNKVSIAVTPEEIAEFRKGIAG